MKSKIKTTITLFFAILGGTLILKYFGYSLLFKSEFNISDNIYEQAFIALFVAVLLTFANGMRVNWSNDK